MHQSVGDFLLCHLVPRENRQLARIPAAKRERTEPQTEPHTAGNYSVGDRVKHSKFGEGMVVSIKPDTAGDVIMVAFPDAGIKKLLTEYAGLEKV